MTSWGLVRKETNQPNLTHFGQTDLGVYDGPRTTLHLWVWKRTSNSTYTHNRRVGQSGHTKRPTGPEDFWVEVPSKDVGSPEGRVVTSSSTVEELHRKLWTVKVQGQKTVRE